MASPWSATPICILEQMGSTFTLVDAPAEPDAIVDAIRAGRVELRTTPMTMFRAASIFSRMVVAGLKGRHSAPDRFAVQLGRPINAVLTRRPACRQPTAMGVDRHHP